MTDRMRSPPYTLSLSLNDQTFFEVDLLFLIFVALVITHFILVTFGFGDICKCPLFKPFDGFAALDDYFELPQSLDYNYKRKNGIKNDINETDDNGKKNPAQRTPVSSDSPSGNSGDPSVLCPVCQDGFKAQSPYLSETSSTSEILVPGSVNLKESVEITCPDIELVSYVKAVLTSLADDLEFDVAHLTQIEAHMILAELQSLRSTVGSRGSLFTKQSDAPVDAFGPDASYGEACLIDALMWLVRKRFPVQSAVTLEFPGFEPAKEGEKKSRVDNSQGYNSGDPEQLEGLEMHSEDEDGSGSESSTSSRHHSRHSSAVCSEYDPYPLSTRVRRVVLSALNVINFVKDGLHNELQTCPVPKLTLFSADSGTEEERSSDLELVPSGAVVILAGVPAVQSTTST
jgi:hypothetical protein